MNLGAHVIIDLVVRLVEVFWRRHLGEAMSNVVSKISAWVGNKDI